MSRSQTFDPRAAVLQRLAARAEGKTVCPSEVARDMAHGTGRSDDDWRGLMPEVHEAVDHLIAEGQVRLSWKGQALAVRSGPYRLRRGPRFPG